MVAESKYDPRGLQESDFEHHWSVTHLLFPLACYLVFVLIVLLYKAVLEEVVPAFPVSPAAFFVSQVTKNL